MELPFKGCHSNSKLLTYTLSSQIKLNWREREQERERERERDREKDCQRGDGSIIHGYIKICIHDLEHVHVIFSSVNFFLLMIRKAMGFACILVLERKQKLEVSKHRPVIWSNSAYHRELQGPHFIYFSYY